MYRRIPSEPTDHHEAAHAFTGRRHRRTLLLGSLPRAADGTPPLPFRQPSSRVCRHELAASNAPASTKLTSEWVLIVLCGVTRAPAIGPAFHANPS